MSLWVVYDEFNARDGSKICWIVKSNIQTKALANDLRNALTAKHGDCSLYVALYSDYEKRSNLRSTVHSKDGQYWHWQLYPHPHKPYFNKWNLIDGKWIFEGGASRKLSFTEKSKPFAE